VSYSLSLSPLFLFSLSQIPGVGQRSIWSSQRRSYGSETWERGSKTGNNGEMEKKRRARGT
jgi:hypothetical protein